MVNKKISKVLGPVLGVMGFMLAIGVLNIPASADDNVQVDSAYTSSTTTAAATTYEYKDYSINVNKSIEQNGLKVTIDKAVATKHKLKVVVKVESKQPFDQEKSDNSIVQVLYGEDHYNGESMSYDYSDDKTLLITIDQDIDEGEFPEKGELRLDVVFPRYKVNIGMDAAVDFSKLFEIGIEKDISAKISESDCTLNKLESNVLGTTISYSEPEKDHEEGYPDSSMILKVGDRMYKARHSSSSSSDDRVINGTYEAKAATYDRIKDQKDISLIPIICNVSYDEMDKIYENIDFKEEDTNKEKIDNVSYIKNFNFSDGSKGEIYNIERNDNSVKVYCKGSSEKASLLIASNVDMYYQFTEDQVNYRSYDSDSYTSFYKDPNNDFGYIVEFDNVDKDEAINLAVYNRSIQLIDKYKIGDEIQVSK